MNAKMTRLGEKTNLSNDEVKQFTRFGISGLFALALSLVTFGWGDTAAAGTPSRPKSDTAKPLPEKCRVVPEELHCKALLSTYYFDSETGTCKEYRGCPSPVFDSREECVSACIGEQAEGPAYPVSKYGAVGLRDFPDAD